MLLLILSALTGLVFIYFGKLSFWRYKCSQLMPGKKISFFNVFGDILDLIPFLNSDYLHFKILEELRKRNELFQRHQLFSVWFFYTPFVFIIKAGATQEVLEGNKLKEKSWVYNFLKPVFGNGLITSSHAVWKPRRKTISRCFHPDILRGFLPIYNEKARNLVKFFQQNGKEFIDITDPVQYCSLDIIYETVFDVKKETSGNDESQFVKSARRVSGLIMKRIYTTWQWPDFVFWSTSNGRKMLFDIKVLKEFTEKVIQQKKKTYSSAGNKMSKGKRQTLIDVLLQNQIETDELSEEDVRDEVTTFALAGYDTAAVTVSWALFLIGQYPEIQAKIHEELDNVFGGDVDRDATEDDLNQLPYLECVLKECLRLYPASPLTARQAEKDTIISGHSIPKGTTIVLLAYFLHRDKDVFPDPEKFDPDRFLPESSAQIPQFAYIPFSAGPRSCIGYRYAQLEVMIVISTIMRYFIVESLDDRSKILPVMHIGLHPTSPICLRFCRRS